MTSNCLKVDYLTLSLLPGVSGLKKSEALDKLLMALNLEDLRTSFEFVGSNYRYEFIFRYSNISLKIPFDVNYDKTGICIEMSGSGVDYYENYLSLHKNSGLRSALNRFRLLYLEGFKTKCSRIDIAVDDKCFGYDLALLDINLIESVLKSRYFVSKFRRSEPKQESGELVSMFIVNPKLIDQQLPFRIIESMNMSTGVIGKTIYLGKRKSNTSVRIYDKMAEQEVKGEQLPPGLNHWVRFEVEFHNNNAGSVLSAFLDSKDDLEFSAYFARVCFDLIRFVDKDRSRLYNCTVCDWWMKFLGSMSDKGMYINKLSTNQYLKSLRYAKLNLAAMLAGLAACNPNVMKDILDEGNGKLSKTKQRIISDYNAYMGLSPPDKTAALEEVYHTLSGDEYWRLFTDENVEEFSKRMKEIKNEVG